MIWNYVPPIVPGIVFAVASVVALLIATLCTSGVPVAIKVGIYCILFGSIASSLYSFAAQYQWISQPIFLVAMLVSYGLAFVFIMGYGYARGSAEIRSTMNQYVRLFIFGLTAMGFLVLLLMRLRK